jgi:hypothetical protein
MTQPDKQLRIIKRRLKEWEAEFSKTHGRRATIKDIAENPSIGRSLAASYPSPALQPFAYPYQRRC